MASLLLLLFIIQILLNLNNRYPTLKVGVDSSRCFAGIIYAGKYLERQGSILLFQNHK